VYADAKRNEKLDNLYDLLISELRTNGYKIENDNYKPHITLAREVQFYPQFNIQNITYEEFDVEITKLTLFCSIRVNGILTYIPLLDADFKKLFIIKKTLV